MRVKHTRVMKSMAGYTEAGNHVSTLHLRASDLEQLRERVTKQFRPTASYSCTERPRKKQTARGFDECGSQIQSFERRRNNEHTIKNATRSVTARANRGMSNHFMTAVICGQLWCCATSLTLRPNLNHLA